MIKNFVSLFILVSLGTFCNADNNSTTKTSTISLSDIFLIPSHNRSTAYLHQVDRSDTAKITGVKALSFVASIASAVTIGVPISIIDESSFSKNDIIGTELKDAVDKERIKNPMYELHSLVQKDFEKICDQNKTLKQLNYKHKISLEPTKYNWKLVYTDLSGSGDAKYHLTFGAMLSQDREKTRKNLFGIENNHRYKLKESCAYESDSFSLADWKANDYQKITEMKKPAVDSCAKQLRVTYPLFAQDLK